LLTCAWCFPVSMMLEPSEAGGRGGVGGVQGLAVAVAVKARAGSKAVGLAREKIVGGAAVAAACVGCGGEADRDAAVSHAGCMGERFRLDRVVRVAFKAGAGAGAVVVAVLGAGDRVSGRRGVPVALVAVARGAEGGAPPAGCALLEMAVDVGAGAKRGGRDRGLVQEDAAVASRGRAVDPLLHLDRLGAVAGVVDQHGGTVALRARLGARVRMALMIPLEGAGGGEAPAGSRIKRRHAVAVIAGEHVLRRGVSRCPCEERRPQRHQQSYHSWVWPSESAVAPHFHSLSQNT